ncbi:TPA: hypothetical protein P2I16_004297 [Aeromonas salmonicida]|nr:hypothetical protein [Aeromonas salmonicida]
MSDVTTSHGLLQVKQEFDVLLANLAEVLKEVRPRTNILNTKLGKIKKDLENIENLDKKSIAKISEIVTKFNTINEIFRNDIEFNKKDLVKIIEGKHNYDLDSNDGYNDSFFELSMALRFLLSLKETKPRINLESECDVIINDKVAIECKYIHSLSNIIKNIRKANNQIDKRVENGQAEIGFIALDLSHVCSKDKVEEFAEYTFNRFVDNYRYLEEKRRISSDILERILVDNNFKKIINSYFMSEVETALYGELGFSYDMGPNVLAIIFQSMNSFCFEYEGRIMPVAVRGMTYFINRDLDDEKTRQVKSYIHSLAVGI